MRHTWILTALVAALGAAPARAAAPDGAPDAGAMSPAHAGGILGLVIELPFDYRTDWIEESHVGGPSFAAMQRIEGEVDVAGGDGRRIAMIASYRSFESLSSVDLAAIAQAAADEAAAGEGVRATARFQLDGFPFDFIDGPVTGDPDYTERMTIGGVVSSGFYRFTVFATDRAVLTPELADSLRAARLDYAALLRIRPRFEEEARMALRDGQLDTPLNRIVLDGRSQGRLTGSIVTRDGNGVVVHRQRDFAIFKSGLMTLQHLGLAVSCGREDLAGWNADEFLRLTRELREDDPDQRPTGISAPTPTTLLGLPALAVTAKGGKVLPMRRSAIRRWLVRDGGIAYGIGVERLNGSPVEKQLVAQFEDAEPRCQFDLQFGDGGRT